MPRQMDLLQHQILDLLAETATPSGSGVLLQAIRERGLDISQATVGRALRVMDKRGLTVKLSNMGRVLTQDGRRWLTEARQRSQSQRLNEQTLLAVGKSTLLELRRSMVARCAIEREIARLAAEHATASQIGELLRIVEAQGDSLHAGGKGGEEAVDFHRALADVCGNRFLAAAANLVRTNSEMLQNLMYHLGTTVGSSYENHMEVLEAITVRNPHAAEAAMVKHLNELITDVDRWLARLSGLTPADDVRAEDSGGSSRILPGRNGGRNARPPRPGPDESLAGASAPVSTRKGG